jgi:hypothetical protein
VEDHRHGNARRSNGLRRQTRNDSIECDPHVLLISLCIYNWNLNTDANLMPTPKNQSRYFVSRCTTENIRSVVHNSQSKWERYRLLAREVSRTHLLRPSVVQPSSSPALFSSVANFRGTSLRVSSRLMLSCLSSTSRCKQGGSHWVPQTQT